MTCQEHNRLHQIGDAIAAILADEQPEIPWRQEVLGPVFPKALTGYICCDSVEFTATSKLSTKAKAVYLIQIISPNATAETSRIEDLAMMTRKVLARNSALDNWADHGFVSQIIFGTAAGNNKIGTALLTYEVQFDMEDMEENIYG